MKSLKIKDLHVEIEGREILKGVNLTVNENEVHALMGPNGNGKSTLLAAIMGHPKYVVTQGEIEYDGKNIVIGTHGTALSSIINYYDKSFNGESFMKIIDFMPWILKMEFDGENFLSMEEVFHIYKEFV